jgi:thioredoxin 1
MPIPFTLNILATSLKPIVLMAFATWCPHCTRMEPLYETLEKQMGSKYTFTRFDVDKSPELAQHFNVQSMPTFIFLRDKKEVARAQGEMPQTQLAQLIEKNLG